MSAFVQHLNNFEFDNPVLNSQRFKLLNGHQGDLPLGRTVESSYVVLLGAGSYSSYVRFPSEVILICFLMGEVR